MASIASELPAEITAPIPVQRCPVCVDDDVHVWSEVGRDDVELEWGRVTLVRSRCVCDLCRRCGARSTRVVVG